MPSIDNGFAQSGAGTIWTDALGRFFGLTPQLVEVDYEVFLNVVHPEDRQTVSALVRAGFEQGGVCRLNHRILLPDGAVRHVYGQAEVFCDPDGQPLKMRGTVQDITESRLAEEEIRKQQKLTSQIVEAIPLRVFWKDLDLRYMGCNTLFANDAGLNRPDELIGKTDFDMGWKEQAEIYRADDRRVIESNIPNLSYDEPQTTPTGGQIWLRTSKVSLHNEVAETIGVLGVYEDITERKHMELRLRESEELFRKAFENSAIGMALVGLDGRWLMVNNALCRIVGYSQQELLSRAFQDITHPDDLQSDLSLVARLLAGEIDHAQEEKRYLHKDGHVVWIRLSVSVIRDEQNIPLYFVCQIDNITADKLAAEALSKANVDLRLFRTLLDNCSDAIEVVDPTTLRYLDVNEKACRDSGYSREELLSMTVFDIDSELNLDRVRFIEEQQRKSGSACIESTHRRKDGSSYAVEVSIGSVTIDKMYSLNIVRDISERKQAAQALRQSEEKFRALVESTSDLIWEVDQAGRYTYVSPRVEKLLGYKPEELAGKTPFDFMPPDEVQRVSQIFERSFAARVPLVALENTNLHKEGLRVVLETSGVPFFDADQSFAGYRGIDRDITERKQTAQALEDSELKFRTILGAAVDGILVADAKSQKFVLGNRAICDMLGYQPEEINQLDVSNIHPPEALCEVQRQFGRQLKGEILVAQNLPVLRKDGSVFFADVSTSPMVLAGRTLLVGVFHDVTERKQVEEKIRQLNDELEEKVQERTRQLLEAQEELVRKEKLAVLGQVAGSVGHELRNPLGVINNAVYFLQTVLADADDTTKEYLNIIKEEIAGSERIVSDLLDAVRTKPSHPVAVGVEELIAQTLRKYSVPATVAVQLEIPATLSALLVDVGQIRQVFRNLISNSVEAMPEGGTLAISAVENRSEGTVTISVRDSGGGIAPEVLAKLFQPLVTTKSRGIGLGLVVVKNLTQSNGGTVEVQSEWCKGTTFLVTLPVCEST
jgi:PAS domain S-box-containing protein